MEPYREGQGLSETLLDKLAKRPLLLIALTASLSFGVQLIPFQMIFSSILLNLKARLPQASTFQLKVLTFKEAAQPFLTPPVLLAFVCFAIFYVAYTSQQEKGESKFEVQSYSPKRTLLYRTSTLGKSLATHFLSHAEGNHVLASEDAIPSFFHDTPLHKQGDSEDILVSDVDKTVTTSADKKSITSDAEENPKQLVKKSGTNKKLSRPATSTALASKAQFVPDRKLDNFPKSFRENPLKIHKEELNQRFESYLENFRRQLELQRQESLEEKKLDLKLKNLNHDVKESNEPSAFVSSFLINDAKSEDGTKEGFSTLQVNVDLSEAELNERIDAFLSGFENRSGREVSETPTVHKHRKWHSNSYTTQRSVDGATIETFTPDLKHSPSQIVRGDSVTNDNEKFDFFLQKFRNELKLQKQKSSVRRHLHLAREI